jgi:hypothetical protein
VDKVDIRPISPENTHNALFVVERGSLMPGQIKISDSFTSESLLSLIKGEIDIIRHSNFYTKSDCSSILPRIDDACDRSNYTLTDDLQSLGTSMGEACLSQENTDRYLRTVAETTHLIRNEICGSQKSPSDTFRLLLDEYWPMGASVGRFNGQTLLPSIIRRWRRSGQANPHIDQRNIPFLEHYDLRKRLGVNIYLETPGEGMGGEIEFWGLITNETEYEEIKRPDYGLDRETLGEPHFVIAPEQGDLLIFDAARIHGVRTIVQGARVTAASFIGVRELDENLVIFA